MGSKTCTLVMVATVFMGSTASAQSSPPLLDQKLQAEIDKLRAETEKTVVDTGKSRIDVDNAAMQALRGQANTGASVSDVSKTAEVAILRRIMAAGAAAKVVDALATPGAKADSSVQPEVIIGTTPPSVDQWLWFEDHSSKLKKKLEMANSRWDQATGGLKSFTAVSGVVALAATILPMLRTETAMTGVDDAIDADELRHVMYAALSEKGYGVDDTELAVSNPVETTRTLFLTLAPAIGEARSNLRQFNGTGSPGPRVRAAGENLKAAVAEYDKLRGKIENPEPGQAGAVAIARQQAFAGSAVNRPLVYLLTTRLAVTAMTKKGFFTGMFGNVPAYAYGTAIFDYAIVSSGGASRRGTVSCTVAKRRMAELAKQRPETLASIGSTMCGVDAKKALPISSEGMRSASDNAR